ncbi:receptor-like kinase binding protein [Neoconidiobolus thromboides FSU 785]|nr:receptor-like kinase binding protein [Neoconidiobolus thromboides FSU 785]
MDSKKQLVFSFIEFLNTCVEDGTIKSEDAESLEVATQCIGEVFGVDVNDAKQKEELSIKPTTLLQIFNVFVKTQKKSQKPATESIEKSTLTDEEKKKKAEEFKGLGNTKLTEKNYSEAIDLYTKAIQLVDNNAVYYSNR